VLALAICTGTAQATNVLQITAAGTALKCDTNSGISGSMVITVKDSTAGTGSAAVTVGAPSVLPPGLALSAPNPSNAQITTTTGSVTYTLTTTSGCGSGLAGGPTALGAWSPTALQFTSKIGPSGAVNPDSTYAPSVTITDTAGTSPLVASTSSVTLTCTNTNGVTSNGSPVNFTVTSNATGGSTGVAVDPATVPGWLSVGLTTPGSLAGSATPVQLQAAFNGTCTGTVGSSKTAYVHVLNPPAPTTSYQQITVTQMVVGPPQLTLSNYSTSVSPMAFTYAKNSSTQPSMSVKVFGPNVFFTVDTTTLPTWLTVNFTSGEATPYVSSASLGFPLQFTVTKVADTMTPQLLTQTINLKVAGYASTSLYVSLDLENTAANLTLAEGTVRNLSWSQNQALPTATITVVSNGAPIAYSTSIASTGTFDAGAVATPAEGFAYSFGTPIAITFNPLDFAGAQPGSTLTAVVGIVWSGGTINVNFSISIQAPNTTAVVTGISPSNLPTAPAGTSFPVTLYGSGFVSSTDPTQKTTVGISTSGHLATDINLVATVQNASTILLNITVPAGTTDPLSFPTTGTGNTVTIGVCNPGGTSCTAATGTIALTIGAGPIIQFGGVTSASTFVPVNSPGGTLAPYDVISIFGSNFCTSNGTGCTSVLYPTVTNNVYGTTVTPDGTRNMQVMFYPHNSTSGGWAAPILFATNNQINAVVPGEIVTTSATLYDIVVKFGTLSSSAYTFTSAATDPGIFVVDAANDGAIILPSGETNSSTYPANLRVASGDSDTVSIYMTGLGMPSSTASNASTGTVSGAVAPTDCLGATPTQAAAGSYEAAADLTTLDGAIVQSAILNTNRLVPCFDPNAYLTVSVGGAAASASSVKWAGFAGNAIAGLYQVNVNLPVYGTALKTLADPSADAAAITGSTQVPIQVTITTPNTSSQSTVGIWVQPAQTVKASATPASGVYPISLAALAAYSTTPVSLDTVTASGGTSQALTVSGATGSDANGAATAGNFSIDSGGIVWINRAFLTGTYSVTILSTDNTPTTPLPPAYLTLTFTVAAP
jgi:uncharacterized protein (TIGR03437 family)